MWKKSRESVNTAKILAEKLGKVWKNKEFIVAVMNAIDGNNDICSQIIDYLDKNSPFVSSEIFAKLSELGCTVNYKNSEIAELRRKCFRGSDRDYNKLFESLRNTQVLLINEWNLNEEDKTKFENANIGDTVDIETEITPLLFINEEDETVLVSIYTSKYEISREHRGKKYCTEEVEFSCVERFIEALKKQGKNVWLSIDSDGREKLMLSCRDKEEPLIMSKKLYDCINSLVREDSSNRTVEKVFDGGDRYLVLATLNGIGPNDIDPDPYYAISKKTMHRCFLSPMRQIQWFIEARKHPYTIEL